MDILFPCPFCGSTPSNIDDYMGDFFWVECLCETAGPNSSSKEGAIIRWNHRKCLPNSPMEKF